MSRYRLTIASLMAVMIPFAFGLVAFREATQFWVDIVFNSVVAFLLLATYKAKCSQGRAGARWTGFAAFGWAHLVLGLIGIPWGLHFGVSPNLLTMTIVDRVWTSVEVDTTSAAATHRLTARDLVVQSLLSLAVGLIGAMTFGFFASRGEPTEPNVTHAA